MVRAIDANQNKKINRPYVQPIYLVHVLLPTGTLYFSDRNYTYNGHNYEDYLYDLQDLGSNLETAGGFLGGQENSNVTLRFKNIPFRAYNYLIQYFDLYPIEKQYVEVYKLYFDNNEVFGSDVSTKMFKGELGNPFDITDMDFKADCSSMLYGKMGQIPFDVIDLADFPDADPDDVGRNRNIIYGKVDKAYCPWTVAGWLTTVAEDLTVVETSIEVSNTDYMNTPPFTAICDNEEIRVTSNVGNVLTCTRGYGGTTAVSHNKGAAFYKKRTDFEAEVAMHPVAQIGDIYIKRAAGSQEWLRVTSGATKYTNTLGRAYIVFSDKVKVEEKTNVVLDDPTHPHTASASSIASKECFPTGGTGACRDGSVATSAACPVNATFTETNWGTVYKTHVYVSCMIGGAGYNVALAGVGTQLLTGSGVPAGAPEFQRVTFVGGTWNAAVTVTKAVGGNVAEIYKVIEYYPTAPTVNNHSSNTSISGNSLANMLIGDSVCADVWGFMDDGTTVVGCSHTYTPNTITGLGAGTVLQRPSHIRKHILVALLGFSLANDVDAASFTAADTLYLAGDYTFAIGGLHEVSTDTMEIFNQFDLQSRSTMFESGGKFYLKFHEIPAIAPTPSITLDADSLSEFPVFNKSDIADVKNKIRAHYYRDYSKDGVSADIYQRVKEVTDATSIAKYGEIIEDIDFSAVADKAAMVADVLEWIIYEKKDTVKLVSCKAFWDATLLQFCDYFLVDSVFWDTVIWKATSVVENPEDQTIQIEGIECIVVP